MAKRISTVFYCTECGNEEPRWLGRCPSCGEWNTLREMPAEPARATGKAGARGGGSAALEIARQLRSPKRGSSDNSDAPVRLSEVSKTAGVRIGTGIGEFDRVLGGGIMEGSSVLVGGEPGIGKSTLMLQTAAHCAASHPVLYISGEESASHLRHRADRLKLPNQDLHVLASPVLETIMEHLDKLAPRIVIVDSIQTLVSSATDSAPGSMNQLRLTVFALAEWARLRGAAVLFVAHVTKEGEIAGPKLVEHMVDAVLMFELSETDVRFLRAQKNRFGSIDELGLFRMGDEGLEEIVDPAQLFLGRRTSSQPAGVLAAPIYEGSRILLLEIQALTVPASAGYGRVYSDRIDARRIGRICAVLERHAGVRLSDQDVYINVAGGVRVTEVAVELAAALAIVSARTGVPLSSTLTAAGELSLSGELREIVRFKQRAAAASDLGFKTGISAGNAEGFWKPAQNIRHAIELAGLAKQG